MLGAICLPLIWVLVLSTRAGGTSFSNLDDPRLSQTYSKPDESHTLIFNPLGKLATDVHYLHVRLPIHLDDLAIQIDDFERSLQNYNKQFANDLQNYSKQFTDDHFDHLANFDPFNMQHILNIQIETVNAMKNRLNHIKEIMPSDPDSRHKRFFDLLFGVVGTAFGIANSFQIGSLNDKLNKEISRTDLLVDITQLHVNHLASLDTQIKNIDTIIDFLTKQNPSLFMHAALTRTSNINSVLTTIENTFTAAQLHRLHPAMFKHDVLQSIIDHTLATAKSLDYISFANKISDLFQLEVSYLYQPHTTTFVLMLHIPLVKPDHLLDMFQYLPFPLAHEQANTHSLIPKVGNEDIFAFSSFNAFKILSRTDLTDCFRLGETHFCKGRNVLQTELEATCLGSIYIQNLNGIRKNCNFEIHPAYEKVYPIGKNKWIISTPQPYSALISCSKNEKITQQIKSGATIQLNPGCMVKLNNHILYAEQEEWFDEPPTKFEWSFNMDHLFPLLKPGDFANALNSLHDYGLHIVDATDIANRLHFANYTEETAKSFFPNASLSHWTNPSTYVVPVVIIFIALAAFMMYSYYRRFNNLKCNPEGNNPSIRIEMNSAGNPPVYQPAEPANCWSASAPTNLRFK